MLKYLKNFILIILLSIEFLVFADSSFAAGLIIPANCTVDVTSCTLNVAGDITNAGTLRASTGTIGLTGNWLSSGVFTSGTGTVTFNGTSGVQTLNTGGLANAFYNLTHNAASTVQVITNLIDINNNFTNSAGTFDANSINMTVAKDWNNDPLATFTPGTATVTLDGTSQSLLGSTSFYSLTKALVNPSPDTLYFSANNTDLQTITHQLTLKGLAGNLLTLEKTGPNAQSNIKLQAGGAQTLQYLNVHNSNAGAGLLLIAGATSTNAGNNTNWSFGNATVTWDGSESVDWDDPFNWDLGYVPAPGDTAEIPPLGGGVLFQPRLTTHVAIGSLNIHANAELSLNGKNLILTGTFTNSGNVKLKGNEATITLTQDTANNGTFTYVGTGTGASIAVRDFGANDYANLAIDDQNGTPDTFVVSAGMKLVGGLTVNGGTLTAPASTATTAFVINGNFTHSGGTFTANSGRVTLGGTNQTITGNTTFYQLSKSVSAADTLTFGAGDTQTVTNDLILTGFSAGQLLNLRSTTPGTYANLTLQSGGLQNISFVDVQDNDAGGGVKLIARNSTTLTHTNNWALSANVTWTGATDTNWDVPTNWDLGLVPGAGDTAIIANVGNQPATLASNVAIGALTINGSATVSTNGKNLIVAGALTNNGTLSRFGTETISFGTMDTTNGIIEYTGNGDGIVDPIVIQDFGASDYASLRINDTHATKDSFSAAAGLVIVNDFTLASGLFTAPASTADTAFTIGGDFIHSGGTFTANSGRVNFNGTTQNITGNTTFYQLKKAVTTADTLSIGAGNTETVTNSLILTGLAGQLLSIRSTSSPTPGKLNLLPGGSQNISFVDVQDSDASGGLGLAARNASIDSGNNTHWFFGVAILNWTGATDTNWDEPTNWDLGVAPGTGDFIFIPDTTGTTNRYPVLATNIAPSDITLQSANSTLTTNGKNMTVSNLFTNNGTVILQGNETVEINSPNLTVGTFMYTGTGGAGPFNPHIADPTSHLTLTNEYHNLTINDPSGAGNFVRSANLNLPGNLTVSGGTLTTSGVNVDVNGNVAISGTGVLVAPGTGKTFTVAGDFSHTAGTFTHSNGTVTLDTTATATITGDTTFYNLASSTATKHIVFTAGSNQTIAHTLSFIGDSSGGGANDIFLRSSVSGTKWSITSSGAAQTVLGLDVKDSNALTNTITCLNCQGGLPADNNNANWIFDQLDIFAPVEITPATFAEVGQTPTILGHAPANTDVTIKGIDTTGSEVVIATTKSDANGVFRVPLGQYNYRDANTIFTNGIQLQIRNDNYLTPSILDAFSNTIVGQVSHLHVLNDGTITTSQVPAITTVNGLSIAVFSNISGNNSRIRGTLPTIAGEGSTVGTTPTAEVWARVYSNVLSANVVKQVGTAVIDGGGNYTITFTTALPGGINYLAVIAHGVASQMLKVYLTDPFGVVFDSTTNKLLNQASVAIYRASDNALAEKSICDNLGNITTVKDIDCTDTNPYVTDATGFYNFLAANGNYYIKVTATGYEYPSQLTSFPAGRSVITGSKGEIFTVNNAVIELDHPVDGNGFLLRIEKDSNKNDLRIGDVVTYTIQIQNLSADNDVENVVLDDRIPPGFKYLSNRVLLDGVKIDEPTGNRPLAFNIGTVPKGAVRVLKYQLVVGAGVAPGKYENLALARYANSVVISNRAIKAVNVIMDPLFDLGNVIGKVFYDLNGNGVQDAPEYDATEGTTIIEKPVPNVQIATEDGTVITTDKEGKYNWPGVLPGRHILRVNERTLPPGTYLTTDKAVILDVTNGAISKVNFGINVDNNQVVGPDAQFFNEQIALTQDANRPAPRLNAAVFSQSGYENKAGPVEEVLSYNGTLVRPVEFRMFTNYSSFVDAWKIKIMDRDTKKLIKHFDGNKFNIYDPIFWDGRGDDGKLVRLDHKYAYVLEVFDGNRARDATREKPLELRVLLTEDEYKAEKQKETDKEYLKSKAEHYTKWEETERAVNGLELQNIKVAGETIKINRQGQDIKTVRIIKDGNLFAEIPLAQYNGLTPQELMNGGISATEKSDNIEFVVPNGDYMMEVIGGKKQGTAPYFQEPEPTGNRALSPVSPVSLPSSLERFTRHLKVGDDYFMFVGMGDAKVGYTFNRGNVEPVQSNDRFQPGFWKEGKAAYYLKGKIKGKYLVTSSFDMDRQQKELYRHLDTNTYYPVYGDQSSINYDATNTQGPLYLLVEWDKSSAIWGNYMVDFKDTEFAAFSRSYYGGKLDYQSLASNPYGDARTKLVVFHADVQQRPSHNEFIGTGGSLYFLKHRDIAQGSDKISIQVRDKITGLVLATKDMKNGADYELDDTQGRILFWQPVAMIAKSESIVSTALLDGNPVYVVADYQYLVHDVLKESSEGARVAQAVGDNLVVGATSVKETQADKNYSLQGTDTTLHLGPDATLKAEYAMTKSNGTSSFISTDGGITFTQLQQGNVESGSAYGIKGDARLFNRFGLEGYYKWIEGTFSTPSSVAQQGKESGGLALTFDVTPVTRITARHDIQRLMNSSNLQAQAQVGASETSTTLIQIVHESERLTLTGAYQLQTVTNRIGDFVTSTNQTSKTLAGKADYALNGRVTLTAGQQFDVIDRNKNITTVGAGVQVTDHLNVRAQEAFSPMGNATTLGATQNVGNKLAVTTDYTVAQMQSGEVNKIASFGAQQKITDKISTAATVAMSDSSTGGKTTTTSVDTHADLTKNTSVQATVGKTISPFGESKTVTAVSATANADKTLEMFDKDATLKATVGLKADAAGTASTSTPPAGTIANPTTDKGLVTTTGLVKTLAVEATRKMDAKTEMASRLEVDENAQGGKTTKITFADKSRINKELEAVSEKTFGMNADGTKNDTKYGLVREVNGRKLEANLTRELADSQSGGISQSNIFGLTGDVNDRLALQGTMGRGEVQNLDGTHTHRTAFALGSGYVYRDPETTMERLKDSTKIEFRYDTGATRTQQYVFYNAFEGKVTDNLSVNGKIDYSKTIDTTSNQVLERHQEIILGAAYRPVNFDRLNLIAQYSYKNSKGPGGQVSVANADVEQTKTQVMAMQAVYDVDENWQLAEKFAMRINDEKVTGFEFNRTHTWLMIHRINYKLDRNWTISGELRKLTQVEAKDSKQGFLLEAARNINDNAQIGIGWNFTQFNDDLTNLSYASQGPFLRMTGKLYDRSPEEKARARAKWLDERVNQWAWTMVRKELEKPDSKVVVDLNHMFAQATAAQKARQYDLAQGIYKDVIMAGQMMFDEASEYIRRQIAYEEKLQEYNKNAEQYFESGEYIKARKLWEKIVDDAKQRVVQ